MLLPDRVSVRRLPSVPEPPWFPSCRAVGWAIAGEHSFHIAEIRSVRHMLESSRTDKDLDLTVWRGEDPWLSSTVAPWPLSPAPLSPAYRTDTDCGAKSC
ncbi:hypothetical protein J4Q44_G00363390 [Coregonus suidteri]|uniref:Uncharacterized protein n=1 Tax=Coregonus suidteri TaxID=861788 RepID=A0AAN8KJU0_9TELE